MKLYKKETLTLAGSPDAGRRTDGTKAGSDAADDGAAIFCGISLVLAVVAVWAAAYHHVLPVMF